MPYTHTSTSPILQFDAAQMRKLDQGHASDTDVSSTSSSFRSDSSSTTTTEFSYRSEPRNTRRKRLRRNNKKTKQQQQKMESIPLELQSQILAMDCEMVGVGMDGLDSALARVTILDFYGDIVYDHYVRPDRKVTDYRTFVSGIREEDLDHAIDLATCRTQVSALLAEHVLVGHALKNDLQALGIRHPWQQTRDTAKYEPFMKTRFDGDVLWPKKLRELVDEHLDYHIQHCGQPHSPFEDAKAALDLYKKVWKKWERVMDYKIRRTNEIQELQKQTITIAQ